MYTVIRSGNENSSGKTLAFSEAKSVPVSAATAAPKLNAISLSTVHRHAHRLGRERVLAHRPPGASGTRVVDEVERDVDDREDGDGHVEVADGEDALVLDGERVAEQLERVDAQDPVRPARDVVSVDRVAVGRHGQVDLQEEQRHDRQVVAGQPA